MMLSIILCALSVGSLIGYACAMLIKSSTMTRLVEENERELRLYKEACDCMQVKMKELIKEINK